MLSLKATKLSVLIYLALFTSYSISFESYDDRLYKISKRHPSFSGFYIDKDGHSVLLLNGSTHVYTVKDSTFKSNSALKTAIGDQLVTDLESFYGSYRFVHTIKIKKVKYSFSQLYEWFHQAFKEFDTLMKLSVNRIDIDEANNAITLGLTNNVYRQEVKNHLLKLDIPDDAISIQQGEPIYLQ